jgi:alkylhydroperoxidase family enzyme
MSWIREEIDNDMANFVKAMSINPTAVQAINQLGDAVSFGASTLTRVQEEAIATTVSVINRCRY